MKIRYRGERDRIIVFEKAFLIWPQRCQVTERMLWGHHYYDVDRRALDIGVYYKRFYHREEVFAMVLNGTGVIEE